MKTLLAITTTCVASDTGLLPGDPKSGGDGDLGSGPIPFDPNAHEIDRGC